MGLLSLASSLCGALAVTVSAISFSEHTTGKNCECLNFKNVYTHDRAKCGAALEWFEDQSVPALFYADTLAPYDREHDRARSAHCDEMKKLDTDKCINSHVGREWGTWCYVDARCNDLNGGRKVHVDGGHLPFKMCSNAVRSRDPTLRDSSPEELAALAKSSNISLGLLVRLAYTGVRADRDGVAEFDLEEKTIETAAQEAVQARGGEPVWFDSNEEAKLPIMLIQGQKVWSVDETSLTFQFEFGSAAPSEHMTGSNCACLNFKSAYTNAEAKCGSALEWFDDPNQPATFYKETLAPYDKRDAETKKFLCREHRKLDTDKCINSQFGREWGTWCYTEAGCNQLNGGHHNEGHLPFKMCNTEVPSGDARLSESSPEEIVALAKSSNVSLGWLVRATYNGIRADRDGVLEEWSLENQTVPNWAQEAVLRTGGGTLWFDTNEEAKFPIILIQGEKLWSVSETSIAWRFEFVRTVFEVVGAGAAEATEMGCSCKNFKEVYEGNKDACGLGLEFHLTEQSKPGPGSNFNLPTPAMYSVDSGKKSDICARYAKLDTDRCVSSHQGRNWGTWCYAGDGCPNLNGGRRLAGGLALKMCASDASEPRLRDYSPEELAEFAKSKGIHFGELVRMAYIGCRADKDGHVNLADFNGTLPADVAKGAETLSTGDGPVWFDTNLEAQFPVVVVQGGKAWRADEAGLACLAGCN